MQRKPPNPPLHHGSVLRDAALKPATLRSYNSHLQKFLSFTRLSLPLLLTFNARWIDSRLAAFIDQLYAKKGSYEYASQALNSLVHHCPPLKHRLGESRLRLRGWSRLKKTRSHPPITWELTVLFAVTMCRQGFVAEGVAALLAFHCYLRVGELTRITYHDVVQPSDARLGAAHTSMALRLADTKTGLNQWVTIADADVADVLMLYLRTRRWHSSDIVFPFTSSRFRCVLHRVAAAFHLSHIPYVPHSFRHGGATSSFLHGATVEQIMFRGRWKSMESARRYIQTGRALLTTLHFPVQLATTGALFADNLVQIMDKFLPELTA